MHCTRQEPRHGGTGGHHQQQGSVAGSWAASEGQVCGGECPLPAGGEACRGTGFTQDSRTHMRAHHVGASSLWCPHRHTPHPHLDLGGLTLGPSSEGWFWVPVQATQAYFPWKGPFSGPGATQSTKTLPQGPKCTLPCRTLTSVPPTFLKGSLTEL